MDARLEQHLQTTYMSLLNQLLKVQRDILSALDGGPVDGGPVAALVLLDLLVAFDTIGHIILLDRLENSYHRRRAQLVEVLPV